MVDWAVCCSLCGLLVWMIAVGWMNRSSAERSPDKDLSATPRVSYGTTPHRDVRLGPPVTAAAPSRKETRGVVRDPDGRPIEGAVVAVFSGTAVPVVCSWQALLETHLLMGTSSDGEFALPEGLESPYVIQCKHEQFVSAQVEVGTSRTLDPDPIVVVMERGESIDGRVIDTNGAGLSEIEIVAMGAFCSSAAGEYPRLGREDAKVARTDLSGGFTFTGLRRSEYLLRILTPGLRLVAPSAWDTPTAVRAGSSGVVLTAEAAAVVHVLVLEQGSGTPLVESRVQWPDPSARSHGFVRASRAAPLRALSAFAGDRILSLHGIDPQWLMGGEQSPGRHIEVGTPEAWPIPAGETVSARVVCAGFDEVEVDVPLHPLTEGVLPEALVVELRRSAGSAGVGRFGVQIVGKDLTSLAGTCRSVLLWRMPIDGKHDESSEPARRGYRINYVPGLTRDEVAEVNSRIERNYARAVESGAQPVRVTGRFDAQGVLRVAGLAAGRYAFNEEGDLLGDPFVIAFDTPDQVVAARETTDPLWRRFHRTRVPVVLRVTDAVGDAIPAFGLDVRSGGRNEDDGFERGSRIAIPVPAGSTLMQSPYRMVLAPGQEYEFVVSAAGFSERSVRVAVGASESTPTLVHVVLVPE